MYGGLLSGSAINGDVWKWDGVAWTQVLGTGLPNRWGHRMAYDSRRNRLVTFGGRSPTTTTTANDTWEFDGATWTRVFPTVNASARAFYSMTYDERRGRTVIFGAQTPPATGACWEYDGVTWAASTATGTPVSRDTPVLVYDKARRVTVLFGGYNASSPGTMYGDTWEYDGNSWTQRFPAHSPAPRYQASAFYDDVRGRIVVNGGLGSATFTDTWEYDGIDWVQVAASGGPPKSTSTGCAFHAATGLGVLFGGSSAAGLGGETWLYSGPTTALFASYGAGTNGGAGIPAVSALTLPVLGQTFSMQVTGIPGGSPTTTLMVGFNNQSGFGLPLPADLASFGLAGCLLETSADLTFDLPNLGGFAQLDVALPGLAALLNVQLWLQAYTFDGASVNGVITLSRPAHCVLGF